MNKLKFELSVLFENNKEIHYLSGNDVIKEEYQRMFRKEVNDEDLAKQVEEIIQDQVNFGQIDVPDDFELNDLRN